MTQIMMTAAALLGSSLLRIKNSGNPTRIPLPKQMSCRPVRLKNTLVFTCDRSLWIRTYAVCAIVASYGLMGIEDALG